ncbi:MAG: metalloregulator ArsR/SmtB family transcription factor [Candidatus Latescibacterota bacterium]
MTDQQTPLDIKTLRKAAEILKTMAHPVRLDIVQYLGDQERAVKEIQAAIGKPQAIVSQQLCVMRERGVLTARRDGTTVYYSVAHPFVLYVLNCMLRCVQEAHL